MNEMQPIPEAKEGNGALIGTIIVILVIILGGIYVLFLKPEATTPNNIEINGGLNSEDSVVNELSQQGESAELSEIEADLNSTNLEDLDTDLNDIEKELNSVL